MCGIIGYSGNRQAAPILLDGLASLEYRGYDSAGVGVASVGSSTHIAKRSGKLSNLISSFNGSMPEGVFGIGHTRWATHGGPTDCNAHPHTDCTGDVIVVHNGIVENYRSLRNELIERGHEFSSQTDTECVPHMIEDYMRQGWTLEEAARFVSQKIKGANAFVIFTTREPGRIVGVRLGNAGGIVFGQSEDGVMLSSDLPPLLRHTRDVTFLNSGEMVTADAMDVKLSALDGSGIDRNPTRIIYDAVSAAKGEHRHFMHKEIHEQPLSMTNALATRISQQDLSVNLPEVAGAASMLDSINRIVFLGMGTSLHAAMLGRHWMENIAKIPCEYDNSSEFRYRNPVLGPDTLVVSICQSGETVDTLAAMELARDSGARQITLCNYIGTQATRIADETILLRAGIEIGVAASKTFTSSLIALLLLAVDFGTRRGTLDADRRREILSETRSLPDLVDSILENEDQYIELANMLERQSDFLFLGRGLGFPMAMEGALKMKEISYIHAEGYPAGEMKHGPISLVDENLPVLAIAPRDSLRDKMMSNISEVRARGGQVIAVATEGDSEIADLVNHVITIPAVSEISNPILVAIPMQLLAYYTAAQRGCDIDQPRNLAKTVTVE